MNHFVFQLIVIWIKRFLESARHGTITTCTVTEAKRQVINSFLLQTSVESLFYFLHTEHKKHSTLQDFF